MPDYDPYDAPGQIAAIRAWREAHPEAKTPIRMDCRACGGTSFIAQQDEVRCWNEGCPTNQTPAPAPDIKPTT
jgi:hypothetical protein